MMLMSNAQIGFADNVLIYFYLYIIYAPCIWYILFRILEGTDRHINATALLI